MQNISSLYISSKSQKQIKLISWAIGLSWVGASLAAAISGQGLPSEQQPALVFYALGLHHYSQGFIPIELLTYSFIHTLNLHLIMNLLVLYSMVQISQLCISPAGFIRLYSLGSVCGGLVYLLMSLSVKEPMPLIGGGTAIMAMCGAFAVLQPQLKIYLWWMVPIRFVWVPVIQFFILMFSVKENPALTLGLVAGLIAGVLYGVAERLWKRYGER